MIFHTRIPGNSRFLVLASVFMALLCSALSASAANYAIYGRVYSAGRLFQGQSAPNNPLTGTPASQILKDKAVKDLDMYAITTRSMVRVSVEDQNGAPLAGPFLVKYNGGYNLSFANPAPNNLSARLVVRSVLTNEKLMESEPVQLSASAGGNTLFLLVEGDIDDVGKPHAGNKLFTMVGRIPNDGSSITPATGLANVSASTAAMFGIPQYRNAPFGSTLNINGAFSVQYYDPSKYCYKVFANGVAIKDPLYKTRYTITNTGVAKAEPMLVGPQKIGAVNDCYAVTPIAASLPGQEIFWNLPDQLIRWNTSSIADAQVTLTLQLYKIATNTVVPLAVSPFSTLKLQINNQPVVVDFASITYGPSNINMLDPAHACEIVNLSQDLKITYKAYHPNAAGYLDSYSFSATPNSGAGLVIASASYTGVPLTGTPVAGSQATLNHGNITHSCAYVLGLAAVARTTDGYWNFNRAYAWKAYYFQ